MENEAINILLTRRSIKSFKDTVPDSDLIDTVLKAGMNAPTGRNLQSPLILLITNKSEIAELERINAEILGKPDSHPFYNAPVVAIVFADRNISTYLYDGSLVMGNMLNAAHALGLGGCWIHRAKETFLTDKGKEIMKKYGITDNFEGIGNCLIGYANCDMPIAKPRKEGYIIEGNR